MSQFKLTVDYDADDRVSHAFTSGPEEVPPEYEDDIQTFINRRRGLPESLAE